MNETRKRPPKGNRDRERSPSSLLETAIKIAVKAHSGQKERNGRPYVTHAFRVMDRVQTDDEKIVAVLHDVLEDTPWTRAMLARQGFPEHLLDALDCVTIREHEPYPAAIRRAATNPIARRVQLADPEDNMDVRRLPFIKASDYRRLNRLLRAYRRLSAPPTTDHNSYVAERNRHGLTA